MYHQLFLTLWQRLAGNPTGAFLYYSKDSWVMGSDGSAGVIRPDLLEEPLLADVKTVTTARDFVLLDQIKEYFCSIYDLSFRVPA